MELLGLGIVTVACFVGFGLLVGILFGFFGMGGSFLVTPALLVFGYPAPVAVGSGLAFVFGTSVVAALSHHDHGQVDYRLAGTMILGLMVGIEVGKRGLFLLEAVGSADAAIGAGYVVLLGTVGLAILRDARSPETRGRSVGIATRFQAITVPPVVALPGGMTVSVWSILATGLGIGVLSGCLGIGGGFLLVPVMIFGFGVPTAIAVGTGIVQIAISGAFGTFVFAASNAVDVPVVAALLAGSALGARIGAGATRLVPEAECREYFAVVLLTGSVATASKQASTAFGIEALGTASVVLIGGTVLLVSAAIVRASIAALETDRERGSPLARSRPPRPDTESRRRSGDEIEARGERERRRGTRNA